MALLSLAVAAVLAHADPVKRINEIKIDPAYIYGEATKLDANEAYDAALNILQFNIQQWYENSDRKNAGKVLRNMTLIADTISTMRGGLHRVLAYVKIAKVEETIRNDAKQVAEGTKKTGNNAVKDAPAHKDPEKDKLLRVLMEKRIYGDFAALVTQKRKEGVVHDASRDFTIQTEDSYLAIFDRTKKGGMLRYLLAPGEGNRDDLISGSRINPDLYFQHHNAYTFLWFVLSTHK